MPTTSKSGKAPAMHGTSDRRSDPGKRAIVDAAHNVAAYILAQNHKRYENWENAVNANGLIALGASTYAAKIREIVDHSVRMQTSDGQLAFGLIVPGDPANVVQRWTGSGTITGTVHAATLGPAVLHVYEATGDKRYLAAARHQFDYLQRVPRTRDGGIVHREEAPELWLDTVWFIVPFLAKFGTVTGNRKAIDDAVLQIEVHVDRLLNTRTNLLRHIWCETPDYIPQSMYWSRGHGWLMAGLVDVWEALPSGHHGRKVIANIFPGVVTALLELQDKTGFWRNILDDRRSPLEASGTMMLAYAIRKSLDLGFMSGREAAGAASRAMGAALQAANPDGTIGLVTLPPGGPGARLGIAPYGQGWFLLAASRFI